jgi:hypothetical protein
MSKAPKPREPGMKKGAIFEDVIGKDDGPKKQDGVKRDGLSQQSPGADRQWIRAEKGGTRHVSGLRRIMRVTRPEIVSYFLFLRAA